MSSVQYCLEGKYIFCGINAAVMDRQNGTGSKYIFELKRFHPHTLPVCNLFLNLYQLNKYSFHFLFQNYFELLLHWVPSFPSSQKQSFPYYVFLSCVYFFLFCALVMAQCMQTVIILGTTFTLVDKHTDNLLRTRASVIFFSGYVCEVHMYVCVCIKWQYSSVYLLYIFIAICVWKKTNIDVFSSYKLIFSSFPQKHFLSTFCPVT